MDKVIYRGRFARLIFIPVKHNKCLRTLCIVISCNTIFQNEIWVIFHSLVVSGWWPSIYLQSITTGGPPIASCTTQVWVLQTFDFLMRGFSFGNLLPHLCFHLYSLPSHRSTSIFRKIYMYVNYLSITCTVFLKKNLRESLLRTWWTPI